MDLGDKIFGIGMLSILGGAIFSIFCANGTWGSRGTKDVYSFEYKGMPAVVQYEDIRWGTDRYQVLIGGRDKVTGKLISDDGKIIDCNKQNYSVSDCPARDFPARDSLEMFRGK